MIDGGLEFMFPDPFLKDPWNISYVYILYNYIIPNIIYQS